ncbi:MAG: EpsI family protein [Candidatus Omnitrophica bacterium]|nr:EpsI family protein [Candidatus Omnitrophota bacterium]
MKNKIDKSYLAIVVLFLFAGAVSWQLFFKEYRQSDTVDAHLFPSEIDGWVAKELPISDGEYAILETRNAFTRKYVSPKGEVVYLFIVYSQNNRKVSHPPEICYTGSGATILRNVVTRVDVPSLDVPIHANRVYLEQRDVEQLMYYWFKVGGAFTANYWKQQLMIVANTLLRKPSSSALIRLSAPVKGQDVEASARAIETFVEVATPHFFEYLP